MKVLVTGATGFIGNHVIQFLLRNRINVIATSTSLERAQKMDWFNEVNYVPFTIGQPLPEDLFEKFGSPERCIHLAWDGLPDYRSLKHETIYFQQHFDFLKTLIEQGLKKLTVVGTCLEYGMQEGALNESMPTSPDLPYPIGKQKLRLALQLLQDHYPFDLDWVRLFYMYGDGQNPKSILAQLNQHIEEKNPVFNMSGGAQIRDYMAVEEVAEVIVNLALLPKGNGIVNCCSGIPVTIKELVEEYIAACNATITLNLGYYPYPDYEPFKFWGDRSKLNQILNESTEDGK